MIDGEFAFVLFDSDKDLMYACRDPYGVRPLYLYKNISKLIIGFASELKCLTDIDDIYYDKENEEFMFTDKCSITQFLPGHFLELNYVNNSNSWAGIWSGINNGNKDLIK